MEWDQLADMKIARGDAVACATRSCDFIYVMGGFTAEGAPTALVERFEVS